MEGMTWQSNAKMPIHPHAQGRFGRVLYTTPLLLYCYIGRAIEKLARILESHRIDGSIILTK